MLGSYPYYRPIILTTLLIILTTLVVYGISCGKNPKFKTITVNQISEAIQYTDKPRFVLMFASWCKGCREKLADIMKYANKYRELDFILISMDQNPDHLRALLKSQSKSQAKIYQLIYDKRAELTQQFHNIGINYQGALPFAILFDHNNNKTAYQNISVKELKSAIQNILPK